MWIILSGLTRWRVRADASYGRTGGEPVRRAKCIAVRSILLCPAGECVILHFPPAWTNKTGVDCYTESVPADLRREIAVCRDAAAPWCRAGWRDVAGSTFNCCTCAVGDVMGLTPVDWIEPNASGDA